MTPLSLISLAKAAWGTVQTVPGTSLTVLALAEKAPLTLEHPLWVLVLAGELIVDLPYGDFRALEVGESLHLEAGLSVTLVPLQETVLLRQQA